MTWPSRSDTTEMPLGSMMLINSTPGLGVCPGGTVSVGSVMFDGGVPVANDCGVVVTGPLGSCTTACIQYVVAASMPATRMEIVPPPAGAFTLHVDRTALLPSGQNWTQADAPSGSVSEKLATRALAVGVIVGEKLDTAGQVLPSRFTVCQSLPSLAAQSQRGNPT